jgi:hypothetical protein
VDGVRRLGDVGVRSLGEVVGAVVVVFVFVAIVGGSGIGALRYWRPRILEFWTLDSCVAWLKPMKMGRKKKRNGDG